MKRSDSFVAWVLVGSLAISFGAACGEAGATISQGELLAQLEAGSPPLLLDVRSSNEFRSGHVPGAVNIPHTELPSRLSELGDAKSREVVVYCERGGRASAAEQALRDAGFSRVLHLEGDMSSWRRNDLPTE